MYNTSTSIDTPLKRKYDKDVDLLSLVLIVSDPKDRSNEMIQELIKWLFFKHPEKRSLFISGSDLAEYSDLEEEIDQMCDMSSVYKEEGRNLGIEEGLERARIQIIKTLLSDGTSIHEIQDFLCRSQKISIQEARALIDKVLED